MTSSHAVANVVWFLLLLACVPLALWLKKRSPTGIAAQGAGLRRVAVLPLSPGQRIVTVEVGQGDDRRWLVLGVTPQSITTLHAMAPQAEAPVSPGATATVGLVPPSFSQLLGRWRAVP